MGFGSLISGAMGFIAGIIAQVLEPTWKLMVELVTWLGTELFYLVYESWENLWHFCASKIIAWIDAAMTLMNLPTISHSLIMVWLNQMNWIFPVDLVITILPGWFTFETALITVRILIKAWR